MFGIRKYRIVEKMTTKTHPNGQVEIITKYITEVRGLFGWSQVTFYDASPKGEDNGREVSFTNFKVIASFNELKYAKQSLAILENPYSEMYKGNKIVKMVGYKTTNDTLDIVPMYVIRNKEYRGVYNEYSYDLANLKDRIDKESSIIIDTKTSVVF
jgi:hypothetical protein